MYSFSLRYNKRMDDSGIREYLGEYKTQRYAFHVFESNPWTTKGTKKKMTRSPRRICTTCILRLVMSLTFWHQYDFDRVRPVEVGSRTVVSAELFFSRVPDNQRAFNTVIYGIFQYLFYSNTPKKYNE